jgi:hypothetical protein
MLQNACTMLLLCMYLCGLFNSSPISEAALLSMFHEIGKFHHVDNLFELVFEGEEHFPLSCDSHMAYLVRECFLLLKI